MGKHVEPNLRYTKSHEWIEQHNDGSFRMGITDHAQESLGDITFFELPEVGKSFKVGETLGFVESVKAVSDIFAPIDMEVTETNQVLTDQPELCNQSPYKDGWYISGKLLNPDQVNGLMDAAVYQTYVESEQ